MHLRVPALAFAFAASLTAIAACVGDDPAPTSPDSSRDDAAATSDAGSDALDTACPTGETSCDGVCVKLSSTAEHCGACKHSCGGGRCTESVCSPVVVAPDVSQPLGVAVTSGSAFWIRDGAVERCPVAGCAGAPFLVTDQVEAGSSRPGGTTIVTDGNQVAWIGVGGTSGSGWDIFSCSVAGCTGGFSPKVSNGLTDKPTQIALESSTLFAAQYNGQPRTGLLATLELTNLGVGTDVPVGIAADATYVYVAGVLQSAMGVDRCTRANGKCSESTRLFTGAGYLAVGGGAVFSTSPEGIKMCLASGCGGSPTILAPNDKEAAAIAANDGFVAWVNAGDEASATGSVRVCKLPDCAGGPRTVVDAQGHPVSVTIADGFVYWANRGVSSTPGSIWRAAL